MSTARRALSVLPTLGVTGIGSLPHTQQELALQMALQHDVPFLPQLPKVDPAELMIPAALDGFPGASFDAEGSCVVDVERWRAQRDRLTLELDRAIDGGGADAFAPTPQACRCVRPFLFEVEARKLPFAKVQLAGPATVRWVVKTSTGQPASELAELDQQLFRFVMAKALALAQAVRRAHATPIVFLDEPGLYALQTDNVRHKVVLQELKVLIGAVQQQGAIVGMHCCSNTDWAAVLGLGLDVISIDARLSLDALVEDQAAWRAFLASGATVSLGIVPTDLASAYTLPELCDSVEATLRATTPPGTAFEALLSRMLLTPACGLGMRSALDAERIVGEVREAQRRLSAVVA